MAEYTLKEIHEKTGGELHGDGSISIRGADKLDTAEEGEISFLANPAYAPLLKKTRASAVIVDAKIDVEVPLPHIRVPEAYYRFLQVFLLFHPRKELQAPGVHPSAVIGEGTELGEEVSIGPRAVVGRRCRVGARTRILAGCVLMDDVTVGEDCLLYPLVSVREECVIGDRVILHNGVVVGSDGFGFAPYEGVYHKIPQVGRVRIGSDVELGANCTLDRATMGETVIHAGVKLDNLVHIAHNVEVGASTVMAAQVGVSGSTKIGHHVMMGGQAGITGHIRLGDYVQIAAQSGVHRNAQDQEVLFGSPARPMRLARRMEAVLSRLPDLMQRLRVLEKKVGTNEGEAP